MIYIDIDNPKNCSLRSQFFKGSRRGVFAAGWSQVLVCSGRVVFVTGWSQVLVCSGREVFMKNRFAIFSGCRRYNRQVRRARAVPFFGKLPKTYSRFWVIAENIFPFLGNC
ncbi:hypothetical protein LJC08_03150 [Methanimicrococcus sp. OttesenSCG-928-J09]|nr:hypothetical protein [Methanimicrococcus sp. OttesenSCG-928-J09]